jgi:hypothetical protein
MEYLPLGKSWIEASVVSFGAWVIGGWSWAVLTKKNYPQGAIRAAVAMPFISSNKVDRNSNRQSRPRDKRGS